MTDVVAVAIISAVPSTVAAIAGLIGALYSRSNHSRLGGLQTDVNSRMSELIKLTGTSAEARGRAEGVEAERTRKD